MKPPTVAGHNARSLSSTARLLVVGLGLGMFALSIAACDNPMNGGPGINNYSGSPLELYHVVEGEETLIGALEKPLAPSSGQDISFTGIFQPVTEGCSLGTLIARRPDGTEVARLENPLCVNEVWVIEADGTSRVEQ